MKSLYYFRDCDTRRYRFPFDSDYGKRIQAILARVLTPNTEITFVNIHHNDCSDSFFTHETSDKRQLTIVNWAHPSNYSDDSSYYRDRLHDLGLDGSALYIPMVSDDEVHFTEGKHGMLLASFDKVKNRLYLLWDAWENHSNAELDMFNHIINFYASELKDHPLFQYVPTPEEEAAYNKVVTFDPLITNPQLGQLNRQYQQYSDQAENYRSELAKMLTQVQILSKQIAVLSLQKELPPVTVNNKWVKHIESTAKGFTIYTNPLFIYNIDKKAFESCVRNNSGYSKYSRLLPEILKGLGRKYGWYAGQYKITINLADNWKINFKCLDNSRKSYWGDGCQHPHVNREGNGCLGDLSELITQAQINFDIVALADVIIQYLQSANLNDPAGAFLYKWDLIEMPTMKDAITGKVLVPSPIAVSVAPRNICLGDMPASGCAVDPSTIRTVDVNLDDEYEDDEYEDRECDDEGNYV